MIYHVEYDYFIIQTFDSLFVPSDVYGGFLYLLGQNPFSGNVIVN